MKGSFLSYCIIFLCQFADIGRYLLFVQCVVAFFILFQPVPDHFFVHSFRSVIEIIGDHHICQLVDLLTVADQHFVILAYCRFFIAAFCFQIQGGLPCNKCLNDSLGSFFRVQCIAFFFRYDDKFIILLINMCIHRILTCLHTFQATDSCLHFLFIILDRRRYGIDLFLIKCQEPDKTILVSHKLLNTAVRSIA